MIIMIDTKKAVVLTIPTYIPMLNSISGECITTIYSQRERNILILFKAKFSATSFAVKINPYKVELC